jgi:hypothetical protein
MILMNGFSVLGEKHSEMHIDVVFVAVVVLVFSDILNKPGLVGWVSSPVMQSNS